jgi:hypothetical protein
MKNKLIIESTSSSVLILEEGFEEKDSLDTPYSVTRTERSDSVVWHGYHTNYKKEKSTGRWTILKDGEFHPMEGIPKYEQFYQKQKKSDINASVVEDILAEQQEVIQSNGIRFNGVPESKILEVFKKHGIEPKNQF